MKNNMLNLLHILLFQLQLLVMLPISEGDAVLPVSVTSNSDELHGDDTVQHDSVMFPDAIRSNGDVCYDEDTDTD